MTIKYATRKEFDQIKAELTYIKAEMSEVKEEIATLRTENHILKKIAIIKDAVTKVIFFERGECSLSKKDLISNTPAFTDIISHLREYKCIHLNITGHSDKRTFLGGDKRNLQLSLDRAIHIQHILLDSNEQLGMAEYERRIDAGRLAIQGLGSKFPFQGQIGSSSKTNMLNRRVEIAIDERSTQKCLLETLESPRNVQNSVKKKSSPSNSTIEESTEMIEAPSVKREQQALGPLDSVVTRDEEDLSEKNEFSLMDVD